MADAIEATVSVLRMIADAEICGGVETRTDEKTVMTARRTPATNVMFVSPTEHVSGDVADDLNASGRNLDHGADPGTGEVALESYLDTIVPVIVGRGDCNTRMETVSAIYPRMTFVNGVSIVRPISSVMKLRTTAVKVATLDDHRSFMSWNVRTPGLSLHAKSAAIAMSSMTPILMPPSCIDAQNGRPRLKARNTIICKDEVFNILESFRDVTEDPFLLSSIRSFDCIFARIPTRRSVLEVNIHASTNPDDLTGVAKPIRGVSRSVASCDSAYTESGGKSPVDDPDIDE